MLKTQRYKQATAYMRNVYSYKKCWEFNGRQ